MMKSATAVIAIAAAFFAAGVVGAGQPDMYTLSGENQNFVGYCSDFEVWEDIAWEAVVKDYFDKEGNWIKQRIKWTVEGVVFNYDHRDSEIPYKNVVYIEHFDFETFESRYTGLWALVTIPGYGNVFIDVGIITYDWLNGTVAFEAGKHQWWNANVEELCQHLTP